MDKINIGNRLREIINDRDLSLDMVVKELKAQYDIEISKGTLSKWENDVNTPVLDERLSALVRYYNISLDYIIGLTNKKTPPHLW